MVEKKIKSDWADDNEKFVAFFDVMGFKDYVFNQSHDKVKDLIESLSNYLEALNDPNSEYDEVKFLREYIKIVLVSDSLILCTKSNSKDDLFCLLMCVGALISGSFTGKIPLKGAISYGQFTFNEEKSIYVGKPLVNAYLIEESIEFYGCVVDHLVEKRIEELDYQSIYSLIPELKIPTKDGRITYHTLSLNHKAPIEVALRNFYKTVSGGARRYVDNSIVVYNELEEIYQKTLDAN